MPTPQRPAAAPARSQDQPRRRPPSRPAPRPEPPPERRPIRTAVLGALVLFLLGSGTVVATPSLLAWMRGQPEHVARVGGLLESQLRAMGMSRLVPDRPEEPLISVPAQPATMEPVEATAEPLALASSADGGITPPAGEPPSPEPVVVTASVPTAPPPAVKAVDRGQVKRMLKEARDLYAQGRLNEVEDMLRGVIEQDPHSPLAYHLLGMVYLERKEEERAFKIFSEAAHQFPDDPTLHYDLGFQYAQRGLGPLAREELTRALVLQPDGGLAIRARLFLKTGTAGRPSGPPIERVKGRPPMESSEGGLPARDLQGPPQVDPSVASETAIRAEAEGPGERTAADAAAANAGTTEGLIQPGGNATQ